MDGKASSLPALYESGDALLRLQLNAWAGLYTDYNPWFASPATYTSRSPIALDPPGAGSTSWAEGMVEFGLAGATRVASPDLYLYGEATGMTSGGHGPGPVPLRHAHRDDVGKGLRRRALGPARRKALGAPVGRAAELAAQQRLPVLALCGRRQRRPEPGAVPEPAHHLPDGGAGRSPQRPAGAGVFRPGPGGTEGLRQQHPLPGPARRLAGRPGAGTWAWPPTACPSRTRCCATGTAASRRAKANAP